MAERKMTLPTNTEFEGTAAVKGGDVALFRQWTEVDPKYLVTIPRTYGGWFWATKRNDARGPFDTREAAVMNAKVVQV